MHNFRLTREAWAGRLALAHAAALAVATGPATSPTGGLT